MKPDFSKIKCYAKGFIDATLVGTIVALGLANWHKEKELDILKDRVEEQSALIQRFGWPRTKDKTTSIPYSKTPKGKPVSTEKSKNPIGFY